MAGSAVTTDLAPASAPARPLVVGVILLGVLVTMVNTSVTNVAAPSIATQLNATSTQLQWIVDGFAIALTSFVLLGGAVGDKHGRKLLFVLGCGLIVPASLLSGFSTGPTMLIAARAFAGLATALLFPTTLSLLTGLFADPEERKRAIAMWSGVAAAGAAVGPIVGGALLDHFWWGSVFVISAPLAAVGCAAGILVLPDVRSADAPPIDYVGGVATVVAVATLLYVIIEAPTEGISVATVVAAVLAVAATTGFLMWERRVTHPLLDLSAFTNRRFSIASLTMVLLSVGLFGALYLGAQYLQDVIGYTALAAGAAVLPLSLSLLVVSPVSARLDTRFGSKRVMTGGLVVEALGFALASRWTAESPYLLVGTTFALLGIGMGLAMTPTTNAIMGSLPRAKAGIGSAVNDVTRDLGSALGTAVFGSIVTLHYTHYFERAFTQLTPEERSGLSASVAQDITNSLTGALGVAQRYPGANADALTHAAREAFLEGQELAMGLGLLMALVAAALVMWKMPDRSTDED